jgi:hypothetical protein
MTAEGVERGWREGGDGMTAEVRGKGSLALR